MLVHLHCQGIQLPMLAKVSVQTSITGRDNFSHSKHPQTSLTCVGITDQYLDWHPDNWGTLSDCKVSFERGRKIENCRSFVVNGECWICWIDGAVPSMLPISHDDMYLLNEGSSNLFIAYCLNTCYSDAGCWYWVSWLFQIFSLHL